MQNEKYYCITLNDELYITNVQAEKGGDHLFYCSTKV